MNSLLLALLPLVPLPCQEQPAEAAPHPLTVEDPAVTITHRVALNAIQLPIAWKWTEKWAGDGAPERTEEGTRVVRAHKIREEFIEMKPEEWAVVLESIGALAEPVDGVLPTDERLLLDWSPSATQVLITPAFYRHPPAESSVLRSYYDHCALSRVIEDPRNTVHSFEELANRPPLPEDPPPPELSTWRVEVHPEGIASMHQTETPPVTTQGSLALPREGAATFSCKQGTEGASVLVIARSVATDHVWLWFEDAGS